MNLRKFVAILSIILVSCLSAFSQSDTVSVKTIVSKTIKYNSDYPFEKVYLHLDKPYYAVGDTIWFKAYVTADVTINDDMTKNKHLPTDSSKVVYVDILSSKDSIVQVIKLPVLAGMAYGNIILPKELYREGNYHIRAYTNWMRNFDPAYFFNKNIPLGTLVDKNVFNNIILSGSVKNNTAKVDAVIHYYTVDGRDYAGRKVSWRAQDIDDETLGKGKGITDSKGNITISFTTNKTSGMNTATLTAGIDINSNIIANSYSLKNIASPTDVQFFPEGGDLINGIRSKVAFKAIAPNGSGIDVKGTITDNSNTIAATITAQHLGMGVFDLEPQAGKTYKAVLTFADGSQNTYDLPKAKDNGITLAINNTDPNRIALTITASDAFFAANKGKMVTILGQSGQVVCYAGQTSLTSKTYSANILRSKFPSGIVQFTIFSSNGEVQAERIAFVQRSDQLKIGLSTPKTSYGARDHVTFNVNAKTSAGLPALANLSVTVLDDKKVPFDDNSENTILTSILLTSELKGYIEQPNYYFNNITAKTSADLDVLMLTQGYRRVSYKEILADKQPAIKYPHEDGIDITGSLRTASGMPVSRGVINFYVKNMRVSATVTTTTNGDFKIPKLFFPDSVKAVINAKGSYNGNNLLIILNNSTSQSATPNINSPDEVINIDTTLNAFLQNDKKVSLNTHVIKEIVIKDVKYKKKISHQDFPLLVGLSGIPDHVIDGDRLSACPNLYECIKTTMPGVTWEQDKLYVSRDYNSGQRTPMAVYLNGMVVDFQDLVSVLPTEVDQIEIFNNDGVSGINRMNGTSGVIVISTKKQEKKKIDKELLNSLLTPQYSAINFSPKGYYTARTFYSPKYDVTKSGSFGGDFRTTIYWNPKVITDKTTGETTFDLFNADGTGTYRAIIEGIDAEGNIGRTIYRYKVQ
jgi:hypothetical protein